MLLLKKGGAEEEAVPTAFGSCLLCSVRVSVHNCLSTSLFLPVGENMLYCGWCPAVRGPLLYVGLQRDGRSRPPAGWTHQSQQINDVASAQSHHGS